ncbi:MAG: CoxG family protein [Candidatus Nanoarchaeia archaeon]
MKIEKDYEIRATSSKVWALISNTKKFGECVPYVESSETINPKHVKLRVRPAFAFLKGKIDMDWKVTALKKNEGKLKIEGKLIGGGFTVLTTLKAKAKGKNTVLNWKADATMKGVLRPIPTSLIQGAATILADKMFACVEAKV